MMNVEKWSKEREQLVQQELNARELISEAKKLEEYENLMSRIKEAQESYKDYIEVGNHLRGHLRSLREELSVNGYVSKCTLPSVRKTSEVVGGLVDTRRVLILMWREKRDWWSDFCWRWLG